MTCFNDLLTPAERRELQAISDFLRDYAFGRIRADISTVRAKRQRYFEYCARMRAFFNSLSPPANVRPEPPEPPPF